MSASDPVQRTGRIVLTDADLAIPPVAVAASTPHTTLEQAVVPAPVAPVAPSVHAAPPAAPPPIAPAMPSSSPPPRRVPRWAIVLPALLLAFLLAVATFFVGQASRPTDLDIAKQMTAQRADLLAQRRSALRDQARDLRSEYRTSLERQLKNAKAEARRAGFAQGQQNFTPTFNADTCVSPITGTYIC